MERLGNERAAFCEACAREIAARFLRMVIRRTPVGDSVSHMEDVKGQSGQATVYQRNTKAHKKGEVKQRKVSDHVGGTLRRGWTAKTEAEAEQGGPSADPQRYLAGMHVNRRGDNYALTVYNPVSYASYVEYGHRQLPGRYVPAIGKRLKQPWVKGKFMMTMTAGDIQAAAPKIIEKKLYQWLERGINGK